MTLDLGVACGEGGSVLALCPTPIFVSPQWFNRPEAGTQRMPGASPPAPHSKPGAPRRLRHRSGGGPAGPGGGARGGQHHGQLPLRSAQPQGLGAVLTPTGPERSRHCAAAVPLHRGRPQARSLSNSFPPRTQKGKVGTRRSAQLDSVRIGLPPCPKMVQK